MNSSWKKSSSPPEADQTQTASVRQSAGGGPETFIIYDELSSPGADDYIIDADYPIETYL